MKGNHKHGHNKNGKTPEYTTWARMKDRCFNKNSKDYPDYGGRGITVCERWVNSFQNFFDDMGTKPSPKHSLDRFPDVNGNYELYNCRWATQKEQQGNRTNNKWIEHDGIKMIQADWARYLGMPVRNIVRDLKRKPFDVIYKERIAAKQNLNSLKQ